MVIIIIVIIIITSSSSSSMIINNHVYTYIRSLAVPPANQRGRPAVDIHN